MTRFLILLACLIAVITGGTEAGVRLGYFEMPGFLWPVTGFTAAVTASVFYLLWRYRGNNFTQVYLFSVTAKILVFGIFVSAVILMDRTGSGANAMVFLVAYFSMTALEIVVLFRKMNG